MTITELFEKITAGEMAGWVLAALIVLLSLIQVSPLKFNPWDNIFAWFGKKMNGESPSLGSAAPVSATAQMNGAMS